MNRANESRSGKGASDRVCRAAAVYRMLLWVVPARVRRSEGDEWVRTFAALAERRVASAGSAQRRFVVAALVVHGW
jgi:hypothetical protein